ncbi:MAG: serine hydrolase [Pyrinomonadaceae bacterium]
MRKYITFALIGLIVAALAFAQGPQPAPNVTKDESAQPKPETPAAGPQLTTEDVGAYLDGIVPQQLERENIAGATLVVVKDGKVLFSRGYGYSDVEKKAPVSPDSTLFRPGSISKLFTWTAVMQQYEQGKIDLDRDVNEYLDFKIPEAFGKPITMKNLLTHSPGFEEQVKDLFSKDLNPDLGAYVKTHIPTRIFAPGANPAYSNYGTAVAGYIVERVSGKPFAEYVNENIFKPLGMTSSTFAQPLPDNLAPHMSKGYRLGSDAPVDFEVVTAFPAGSLSSTAADMSKFMIAHLQNGNAGGATILKPETAKLMYERLLPQDPSMNSMAHGFYEESRNGLRIIGHGGDTIAFHSDLHLIHEKNVGFFISYNSGGKGEASPRSMIWESFLDRYYPYTKAPGDNANAKEEAQSVAGNYESSRRSDTSFLNMASLLGEATVAPTEDGKIIVSAFNESSGVPKKWERIAPMTFRDVNGQDKLLFKPNADGKMRMLLGYPFMTFERVGLGRNAKLMLPALVISLIIMGLTLLLTPVAWIVRRRYGQKLELDGTERWLRRGVWVVFVLNLISVIGMAALLTYGLSHIEMFGEDGKYKFYIFQIIGLIGAVGTLVVVYNAVKAWMSTNYRIWGKIVATVLALACFGFLWFAFASNLFIPRSTY